MRIVTEIITGDSPEIAEKRQTNPARRCLLAGMSNKIWGLSIN
jgi:hypothetical protein